MTDLESAAIKTVEWALDFDFCNACGMCLMQHSDGQTCMGHEDCPIPPLGAAILKEHHFMQRVCTNCGDYMEVGDTEELCRTRYSPLPGSATPVIY